MNNKRYLGAIALAASTTAILATIGTANATDWTVVPETSSVGFVAEQQGTRFNGRFETFEATVSLDPAAPESGHIVGVVDTSTVSTRDHDRDAALREADWFDTANYPQARFESESIKKLDDGSYEAAGQLELKGTTKPAKLTFTLDTSSGARAAFDGKMSVNRFDFNVGEGWNDTSWVGQNVQVEVKLDLTP
jgi:polyisoprenoid-binding protein YceI